MTQLTQQEVLTIDESLRAHETIIEVMGMHQQNCQNHDLAEILQRQQSVMQVHYDVLDRWVSGGGKDPNFDGVTTGYRPFQIQAGSSSGQQRPDGRTNRLEDRVMATDILLHLKGCASTDTKATLECDTPQLRQDFQAILNDHLNLQDELFRFMKKQGWYKPSQAPQQIVQQIDNAWQPPQGDVNYQQVQQQYGQQQPYQPAQYNYGRT